MKHPLQKHLYAAAIFSAVTFFLSPALASEKVDICARPTYEMKSYHVQATNTSGAELNEAMRFSNYDSLNQYIVIFWDQNQMSVIQMGRDFYAPSVFESFGTDQEGHSWAISTYSPHTC